MQAEEEAKKRRFRFGPPSAAFVAAVAAAAIMIFALMIPPVIGMADNGDFYRITIGEGIYKLDRYEDDQYFSYASTDFGVYQYFNEYESGGITSSQTPLIWMARGLCAFFTGSSAIFDIRFLGGLLIAYCTAAIYFIVDYAAYHMNRIASYLTAALCVFVFADTGYTAYFNSFFAEGLVLVSFLFMMACALLITQKRYSLRLLLPLFIINALILTTSKQQSAPLGVLAAVMLVILGFMMTKKPKTNSLYEEPPTEKPYIRSRLGFRLTTVVCAAALCLGGVANYVLIPQEFVNINAYHSMTRGVLMTAADPEEALKEFGIDPQYALLNKSTYYDRYSLIDPNSEILLENFYPHIGFVAITQYYLRHPGQMMQMLDLAAKKAWAIRPDSMGNYDRSAGLKAGAQTNFFTAYSTFKRNLMPTTIGFIIVWALVLLIFGHKDRKRNLIIGFSILMGLSQIFVSIIGAGDADLSKHIFLFGAAFDFATFISIAAVISFVSRKMELRSASRRAAEETVRAKLDFSDDTAKKGAET